MTEADKDPQNKDIKETIRELILQKIEQVKISKEPDYFLILGVNKESTDFEIKEAYYKLAKLIHPDLLDKHGLAGMREQANIAFKGVNEAYTILSDKVKRQKYINGELKSASTNNRQTDKKKNIEEAKIFFHKGQTLLKRRNYREAEECFKKAMDLDETQGQYYLNLGWSIFQNLEYNGNNRGSRLEDVKKLFEKALSLSHGDPQPFYYLSLYYKTLGDVDKQRDCLHDALARNPKYLDAQREFRLLRMRHAKKGLGFFRAIKKLFKKR